MKDFPPKSGDPLEFSEGAWWFWDETWSDRYGPYGTRDEAVQALKIYCAMLDSPKPEESPPRSLIRIRAGGVKHS